VIAEISLSVIVLIGAILLIRSFDALLNVPLGFESENVLIMETSIATANDVDASRQATNTYKKLLVDLSKSPESWQ
jgi:hypothetical protein